MTWRTYETEIEGESGPIPAIVMVDDRLLGDAPISGVTRRIRVAVRTQLPPGGALCDPAETEQLEEIEDSLLGITHEMAHGWAVYVLRICTPGLREYTFYAFEHAAVDSLQSILSERYPEYEIECEETQDPDWEVYRKYAVFDERFEITGPRDETKD